MARIIKLQLNKITSWVIRLKYVGTSIYNMELILLICDALKLHYSLDRSPLGKNVQGHFKLS